MAGVPDFLDVLSEMAFCCYCRAAIPEKIAVLGLSGSFFVPTTILMRKNKRMMYGGAGLLCCGSGC
jgi:hypothetical protein